MSFNLRFNCLKFSVLFVFLLFLQSAQSQTGKKNDKEYGLARFPELDGALTQYQKLLGNDVVALVWTDTLAFKKEMGDFNSKTEAPIASASKWLTATLILELVDEGKLSLDDKVSRYLPIFELYGKNYIYHPALPFTFYWYSIRKRDDGLFTKEKVRFNLKKK